MAKVLKVPDGEEKLPKRKIAEHFCRKFLQTDDRLTERR